MNDAPLQHPDDRLHELLDGQLPAGERAAVEDHLASCTRCQRLRESLLAARRLLRSTGGEAAPPGLAARVRSALATAGPGNPPLGGAGAEAPAAATTGRGERAWRRALAGGLAAAALLAALGVALRWRAATLDPLPDLLALHRTAAADPATHQPAMVGPARLEQHLAASLPFRARVLDLAMMGVHLVGGGTAEVAGTPAAWMLYQDAHGKLLCAMWRSRLDDLPPPDATHESGAFSFRIYTRDGITLVAWQEGELVCALVGGGDAAALLALATEKAMLPA